jgi:phage replication-related protein YjqB (UPF0714/DUF867 family)
MEIEYRRATGTKRFLICAIHAATEHGTAEFAKTLAAADPKNRGLYIFYGPRVTSTEFHERTFDQVVKSYDIVVSIHGMLNTTVPVFVGGRNRRLVHAFRMMFGDNRPPRRLAGCSPDNVVNRGIQDGIQLELAPLSLQPKTPLNAWLLQSINALLLQH